jgi:hypothetical protein
MDTQDKELDSMPSVKNGTFLEQSVEVNSFTAFTSP